MCNLNNEWVSSSYLTIFIIFPKWMTATSIKVNSLNIRDFFNGKNCEFKLIELGDRTNQLRLKSIQQVYRIRSHAINVNITDRFNLISELVTNIVLSVQDLFKLNNRKHTQKLNGINRKEKESFCSKLI